MIKIVASQPGKSPRWEISPWQGFRTVTVGDIKMMITLCENQKVWTPEGDALPWYPTSWGVLLPRYLNYGVGDIPTGLYLALFHGCKTPNEEINDWGINGPMIGPLSYIRTTYMHILQLDFMDANVARRYFPERDSCTWELNTVADMIEFDGCYFGEWTVFVHPNLL